MYVLHRILNAALIFLVLGSHRIFRLTSRRIAHQLDQFVTIRPIFDLSKAKVQLSHCFAFRCSSFPSVLSRKTDFLGGMTLPITWSVHTWSHTAHYELQDHQWLERKGLRVCIRQPDPSHTKDHSTTAKNTNDSERHKDTKRGTRTLTCYENENVHRGSQAC